VLDDSYTTETHLRILRVEGTATIRNNDQKYLVEVPPVQMLAFLQTILWAAASTTAPCCTELHCPLQTYVIARLQVQKVGALSTAWQLVGPELCIRNRWALFAAQRCHSDFTWMFVLDLHM
jgi:hypothetical protein